MSMWHSTVGRELKTERFARLPVPFCCSFTISNLSTKCGEKSSYILTYGYITGLFSICRIRFNVVYVYLMFYRFHIGNPVTASDSKKHFFPLWWCFLWNSKLIVLCIAFIFCAIKINEKCELYFKDKWGFSPWTYNMTLLSSRYLQEMHSFGAHCCCAVCRDVCSYVPMSSMLDPVGDVGHWAIWAPVVILVNNQFCRLCAFATATGSCLDY